VALARAADPVLVRAELDLGQWTTAMVRERIVTAASPGQVLERVLLTLVGVVDTEFFFGTADRVLVGHPDGCMDTLRRVEGRSP
jgi:hypothetical protein